MSDNSVRSLKQAQPVAEETAVFHSRHPKRYWNEGITTKSFRGLNGVTEHFLSITAPAGFSFERQLEIVENRYVEALRALDISLGTDVFRRVFLSDILNQHAILRESDLLAGESADNPAAVSIVQQPPLPGAKISLLAYHVVGEKPLRKTRLSPNHLLIGSPGCRQLLTTGLCAGARDDGGSAAGQTHKIFTDMINALADHDATLRDHCVRTWIYLKDVDLFYKGMVDSRTALFTEEGLTADTNYIASTGIEGACSNQFDLVAMDAWSMPDLMPEQVSYLNDFSRLCPTKDYNVTFERGTRIAYADRAHHFISGTASIDGTGKIVHPGKVIKQLEHALENVDTLLRSGGASIDDMMHMIVYLRDPSDFAAIDARLREQFPDIPTIVVQGAVCRPGWLVEVEGMAIAPYDAPSLPEFMIG